MEEKYYVSNYGRLYSGEIVPDLSIYTEITREFYLQLLKVAGYAWSGWYNVKNQ